jgi:hypothetical protein
VSNNGLYITLNSPEARDLYLHNGIYGQHMKVDNCGPKPPDVHYKALADYSCVRDGTHVFFFLDREIYYGGQVDGSSEHAAFYLNGDRSPLGNEANASLGWDESRLYEATNTPGVFRHNDVERCQPYLIQFEDRNGLRGRYIRSDEFYYELAWYPYLLPGNTIAGMGFCVLTPGETQDLLRLLEDDPVGECDPAPPVEVERGYLPPYDPEYDIDRLEAARFESHLEAALAANPALRPESLQSTNPVCRQVPISPPRPGTPDQADLCFYPHDAPEAGRLPKHIVELKRPKNPERGGNGGRADDREGRKIARYLDALHGLIGDDANQISVTVLADRFKDGTHPQSKPPYFTDEIEPYADHIERLTHSDLQSQLDGQRTLD